MAMGDMRALRFLPCGESAMIIECTDLDAALGLYRALDAAVSAAKSHAGSDSPLAAVTTLLPAARSVYVAYDRLRIGEVRLREMGPRLRESDIHLRDSQERLRDFRVRLRETICRLRAHAVKATPKRTLEIPVTYDGEDIEDVADLLGISVSQVVSRHAGHPWTVAFGGFAPGFDYLVGGDPIFDVPRRKAPRLAVPAGSVGLAGTFSGVYPRASSGGWQLIGTTTTPMWNDTADPPALLRPGDVVRFTPERAEAVLQGGLQWHTAQAHPETAQANTSFTQADSQIMQTDPQTAQASVQIVQADTRNMQAGATLAALQAPMQPEPHAPETVPAPTEATMPTSIPTTGHTNAPALEIVAPGVLATIQDRGRHAPEMGVTGSGAADPRAFALANELAGNPAGAPAIEVTFGGAAFTAHGDLVVAVAGAPVPVTITTPAKASTGSASSGFTATSDATLPPVPATPVPATPASATRASATRASTMPSAMFVTSFSVTRQEAFLLRDGETLSLGVPSAGLRDYVAVRGGIAVPTVLGSASTDTMSGIGPAPLRRGDLLPVRAAPAMDACANGPCNGFAVPMPSSVGLPQPWPDDLPRANGPATTLTVTMGPRDDWFTEDGIATFLDTTWTVTAQSNRVGLRLASSHSTHRTRQTAHVERSGHTLERVDPGKELKSEATVPGSIEVPGTGLPLIFLRDQPVTGGYPVIAVLTDDALAMAGQLPPGALVRFTTGGAAGTSAARTTQADSATPRRTTSERTI